MADGPRAHDAEQDQALAAAARLHATGDSAGALEVLPALVAARPDDGAVRVLLARCLASAGTPAVALAAADAAVACDPTSWEAHAALARAAATIDPDRADAAAAEAVRLAPGEPEAHRAQADVQAARAAKAAPDEVGGRRIAGGIGAALARRSGSTATATATGSPPDGPRLTPRLPAALAGVAPDGPAAAPTAAPRPRGARHRVVTATTGAPPIEPTATTATGDDQVGGARLALRIVGLGFWLLVGFRVGIQGVGGPAGIGIFLACLGVVAALGRQVTRR